MTNKFLSDVKRLNKYWLNDFVSGRSTLKVFIRDCEGKLFTNNFSLIGLKYHLNKNRGYNLKCTEYVGIVAPKGDLVGKYKASDFVW